MINKDDHLVDLKDLKKFDEYKDRTNTYEKLLNAPIVYQDLNDSNFTPTLNTYYRHIGVNSSNFKVGGIYYYETISLGLISKNRYSLVGHHSLVELSNTEQIDLNNIRKSNQYLIRVANIPPYVPIVNAPTYLTNKDLSFFLEVETDLGKTTQTINIGTYLATRYYSQNTFTWTDWVELDISQINSDITTINSKIPSEASDSNKLADKLFVSNNYVSKVLQSNIVYGRDTNGEYSYIISQNAIGNSIVIRNERGNVVGTTPIDDNEYTTKAFLNSSIATNTANYISDNGLPFNNVTSLRNYSGTVTNNDYAFVMNQLLPDFSSVSDLELYDKSLLSNYDYAYVDVGNDLYDLYSFDILSQSWILEESAIDKSSAQLNNAYNRYKYVATTSQWVFEYTLNNSSFTAAQWAAINSGITSGKIELIDSLLSGLRTDLNSHINNISNPHNVTKSQIGLNLVENERQYSANNPPPYPVTSVNTKTGVVVLDADDIDDSETNNKFVTVAEKATWNAKQNAIQFDTIPTPTEDNLGAIIQYTGTTDTTYINGHFYTCKAQGTDPETYVWEEIEFGGGTVVEAANWAWSNTALSGIKIGDTTYRLLPIGDGFGTNLTIGSNSRAGGLSRCLAIGAEARCGTHDTMVIGNGARCGVRFGLCFDDTTGNYDKILLLRDTSKIFFRNEKNNERYYALSQYANGHTLRDYIGDYFQKTTEHTTSGGESTIEITVDDNSNAYDYDGVYVHVKTPQGTTSFTYQIISQATAGGCVLFENTQNGYGVSTTGIAHAVAMAQKKNGMWFKQSKSGMTAGYKVDMSSALFDVQPIDTTNQKINKIIVRSSNGTDVFPEGTVITVYAY